ncbi:MAG: transposase, partial [Ruminococcus sp.]|nr:transposase [Ruminococcus sp.]
FSFRDGCAFSSSRYMRCCLYDYIKDILIPNLKKDDIVIMDNMRSHHTKMVTQLFDDENISYKLLSLYSPDLNPIEKMWSKMKAFLRKQKVRAVDKLSDAINDALKTISVSDCIGWFHSCGYMQ